jgi:type III restriction enzyme
VVFFKSSLNTGWDCPRAEVMMSFRSANDATHIAQLVGRMVRTPLTRRIEADERLNSVALFLPHYDAEGLKEVVSRLTAPDSESAIASDVVTVEALSCAKAPGSEQAFEMLSCLPSYSVPKSPQPNETRRLMKLARALARDEILKYAPELAAARIHEVIDEALEKERETVRFKELVEERDTLDIMIIDQLLGNSEIAEGSAEAIRTSPENIADLFESAGRKLGDGLHKEWWRRRAYLPKRNGLLFCRAK